MRDKNPAMNFTKKVKPFFSLNVLEWHRLGEWSAINFVGMVIYRMSGNDQV